MPSLLTSHLEQISLCSTSISTLPFQTPKIFSNALLANHDITSLIRDTETHERALFHLAAPNLPQSSRTNPPTTSSDAKSSSISAPAPPPQRRATAYGPYGARQPKNKAVAAVLGGDLYAQTRAPKQDRTKSGPGEIDIEILLHGAEKLAAVYPIPGASSRIAELRRRQQQLEANVRYYEERVARQGRELERMRGGASWGGGEGEGDLDGMDGVEGVGEGKGEVVRMTKEDLAREEEECRELERKKRGLEERVTGMERDLGGLMR